MATDSAVIPLDPYIGKRLLAWTAKNIFIPLTPFAIGALIRSLSGVQGSRQIFDAGELCFSMAMLSMLVISSASRLDDKDLRDGITNAFIFCVFLFIVLFAFTSVAKAQIESTMAEAMSNVQNSLQAGRVVAVDKLNESELAKFRSMVNNVWIWAIVPSVITVATALVCKFKYKLQD